MWLLGFLSIVMPPSLESGSPRSGLFDLEDESLHLQNIGHCESTKHDNPEDLNLHQCWCQNFVSSWEVLPVMDICIILLPVLFRVQVSTSALMLKFVAWLCLTLCHSYLKPYCMGRKTVFFSGHLNV
jgi:hypothetical protein